MSFDERNLSVGQKVWALINDISHDGSLIVNFNGDLVRVENASEKVFKVDDRVRVLVMGIKPTVLKVLEPRVSAIIKKSIDVRI